jgi:hypothetical protein
MVRVTGESRAGDDRAAARWRELDFDTGLRGVK